MKKRGEKGYTVIDIAIAVVVLFLFISLIAMLSYYFNSSSKEIELKSEATALAVEAIEEMKNIPFEEIANRSKLNQNSQYFPEDTSKETEEIKEGFSKRVIIEDYADMSSGKVPGLVKKVTVQIQYRFKKDIQTVELSTIMSKEK